MAAEEDEATKVDAPRAQRGSGTPRPGDSGAMTDTEVEADQTTCDLGGEHTRPDLPRSVRPGPGRLDERSPGSTSDSLASFGSLASGESKSSSVTLGEAMQLQDFERARWFVRVAVLVCVVVVLPLPWLGGHPVMAVVFGVAMVVCGLTAGWLAWQLRDPSQFSMRRIIGVGFVLTAGALVSIVYTGMFSPAAAAIPFGLAFIGLSRSARGTLAIYLTCAIVYGGIASAIIFGLIDDPGLITADHLPIINQLSLLGLTETVFFATYLVSRFSYRAAEQSLTHHDRAVRQLAAREALLKEARFDLEGALRARGLGRFTDEIVGDYRLGALLGRGGMGEVYAGVHVDTEEAAAVKLLHAQVLNDPETVARFVRECRVAAMVEMPNVVRVIGTSDESEPIPFIAMERLHGQDLSDLLRAGGPLKLPEVIRCVREVGAGLDAAREHGIVHRDIKPRNLFLAEAGDGSSTWKILDFGISKVLTEATMTQRNMVGTPSYMAPEQANGAQVSHRTDLYALGVIAYRALTGRPAFSGDGVPQILYQVIHGMPPQPSLLARCPSDVDQVLMIAMAKDPEDRFDSGAGLAMSLEAAARRRLPPELRERADGLSAKHPWSRA
jgi:hypothetical protein